MRPRRTAPVDGGSMPRLLCFRDLPHRPGQDSASSPGPGGRQQVPRDPIQGHAPCYNEDRTRGGAPGSVFRVSPGLHTHTHTLVSPKPSFLKVAYAFYLFTLYCTI